MNYISVINPWYTFPQKDTGEALYKKFLKTSGFSLLNHLPWRANDHFYKGICFY